MLTRFIAITLFIILTGCGGSGGGSSPPDYALSDDTEQSENQNNNQSTGSEQELNPATREAIAAVEAQLALQLDAYPTDADFTLLLETSDGHSFTHSIGASNATQLYESASTSKLVTAAVILHFVEQGYLDLDTRPQEVIEGWPLEGKLSNITLAHLLSFTSGLNIDPVCINLAAADFYDCVVQILLANPNLPEPGSSFSYGSAHMQVAGLMTIMATGLADWGEVFAEFKAATGLFPTAVYDLPSLENPRLAGGMHWRGEEYMGFLRALYQGQLFSDATLATLLNDYVQASSITNSPLLKQLGQDWHYGLGFWIECSSAQFNCVDKWRISSPGAYGAYPFIDFEASYFGLLARQGKLWSTLQGLRLMADHRELMDEWARLHQ